MHPILIEVPTPFGEMPIFTYGVCIALAVVGGWYLVVPSRGDPEAHEAWARRYLAFMVAGALFGHAGEVALRVLSGGGLPNPISGLSLSAPFAIVGGLLGAMWTTRERPFDLRALLDAFAPVLVLLMFADGVGHLAHGSQGGAPIEAEGAAWLAVFYGDTARHPLPLYQCAIGALALFLLLRPPRRLASRFRAGIPALFALGIVGTTLLALKAARPARPTDASLLAHLLAWAGLVGAAFRLVDRAPSPEGKGAAR